MTTTSRDQNINELKSRIKLLEKQQSKAGQYMQEQLLLLLVSESIHLAEDVDDLLLLVLQRFALILNLSEAAYFDVAGLKADPVVVFSLKADKGKDEYELIIDRQVAGELKKGPLILNKGDEGYSRINAEKGFSTPQQTIALFPFQTLYAPFGLFAFISKDDKKDHLISIAPVIQQLIRFVAEKFEKIKLRQELKDLNHSFEEELDKRTKVLQDQVDKLKGQVRDQQKKARQTQKVKPGKPHTDRELLNSVLRSIGLEIRTPLNGIMGFAELIRDNELVQDEKNKYIDIIKSCGKSLVKIVDDAQEYARIKSGQVEVSRSDFPLAPFMTDLYDHYKKDELFRQRTNLELRINLNINGISEINADRDKLMLVLTNLIGNSIKFTDSGFIEFGCSMPERKSNRSLSKKQDVLFFVKDTGIGISEDHQEKIFGEFYKVEHEISKLYGGLGLGLSIAKVLVEMMGGKIWFDSEKGKGTNFYFSLPEALVLSEAELEVLKENGMDEPLDWSDKKILMVEDDAMSVIYLKEALKASGAQLMHASDGISAVELVKGRIPIDLILMDIKLPGISGYEATRQIKEIADIPIIAQTAYAMADDYKKIIQAGCDDYISKPINRRNLLRKIYDIFAKEGRQTSP